MMKEVDRNLKSNPKIGFSSSPYIYIRDNPYLDELVNYGWEIVPLLERKIDNSNENSKKEYFFAIAIEKITKTDLRRGSGWGTGKDFIITWKYHLRLIPSRVEKIMASNLDKNIKEERLVKLGVMSIPPLLENIENNDTNIDMKEVLSRLLTEKEKKELKFSENTNLKEWTKNNKYYFNKIKKYVESKKSYTY